MMRVFCVGEGPHGQGHYYNEGLQESMSLLLVIMASIEGLTKWKRCAQKNSKDEIIQKNHKPNTLEGLKIGKIYMEKWEILLPK
jgi:hypothetical protein